MKQLREAPTPVASSSSAAASEPAAAFDLDREVEKLLDVFADVPDEHHEALLERFLDQVAYRKMARTDDDPNATVIEGVAAEVGQ